MHGFSRTQDFLSYWILVLDHVAIFSVIPPTHSGNTSLRPTTTQQPQSNAGINIKLILYLYTYLLVYYTYLLVIAAFFYISVTTQPISEHETRLRGPSVFVKGDFTVLAVFSASNSRMSPRSLLPAQYCITLE